MAWRIPHVADEVLRVLEPSGWLEIAVDFLGHLADESGGAVFPI